MITVDIVTTTYRNTKKLKMCLSHVFSKTRCAEYNWYLFANDPNDEVKEIINGAMYREGYLYNDRIKPIFNDSNDGSFSRNNNQAAGLGSGDYILFLNDDVTPINSDWLGSMVTVAEAVPNAGQVGALLLYPGVQKIQHCGVFFSKKTNNLPYHMFYRQNVSDHTQYILRPRYYQAVTGACMLVKRKYFEDVGGFDEGYWYMYEDIDLCLRINRKLNKKAVYCPYSKLIHHEGISGSGNNNPHFKKNIEYFLKRCGNKYHDDYDKYLSDPNNETISFIKQHV